MTAEMGKPLAEARGEVAYGAEFFRWFSEEAVRIGGDHTTSVDGNTRIMITKEPVGPCVLVTPWNFPLAMGTRKIGPAVAAGCTMVFKPAELTPLTSLALVQHLQGGRPARRRAQHRDHLQRRRRRGDLDGQRHRPQDQLHRLHRGRQDPARPGAPSNVMRTSMELGGNAPFIVLDDADLDKAVDGRHDRQDAQHGRGLHRRQPLLRPPLRRRRIRREVRQEDRPNCEVGDGAWTGTEVGPLIEQKGLDKVESLVADAVSKGARILTGGSRPEGPGYFYPPPS